MISEAQVLAAVLMHVPPKVKGLHLFRQGVGLIRVDETRVVRFGIPGMADVAGILSPQGWRVEIECKRYGQNLSEKQHQWAGNIMSWGGAFYVARPLLNEPLDEAVNRWAEDLNRLFEEKRRGK